MSLLEWSLENVSEWESDSVLIMTGHGRDFCHPGRVFPGVEFVTKQQWQSTLAASQQITWNGEGLPPVGTECEITAHNSRWGLLGGSSYLGSVIAYSGEDFWFKHNDGTSTVTRTDKVDFRPNRTEAERKREDRIASLDNFISGFMKSTDGDHAHLGEAIYEWLAVLDRLK